MKKSSPFLKKGFFSRHYEHKSQTKVSYILCIYVGDLTSHLCVWQVFPQQEKKNIIRDLCEDVIRMTDDKKVKDKTEKQGDTSRQIF